MTEAAFWTSSRKDMVGGTPSRTRLWFTIAEGMLTEVFYPRVDLAQIKELNFIIGDGQGFWTDLDGIDDYEVEEPSPGIPAVTVRHRHDRFCFISKICADPARDVVLIDIDLDGDEALRAYALLTPRLGELAADHRAAQLKIDGFKALTAQKDPFAVALLAVDEAGGDALGQINVGLIGESDTWQDFARHGRMTWLNAETGPGYVCLAASLPRRATLAVGLAGSATGAATLARASLAVPFAKTWDAYRRLWQAYVSQLGIPEGVDDEVRSMLVRSAVILKLAMDHTFPGALIASPSTPWGESKESRGGYHLVWSRDLAEGAGGLIALGLYDDARDIVRYLIATQRPDGHWYQNQWISGDPHWKAIQLDETAFPVLLSGLLADRQELDGLDVAGMVRKALGFIARQGPVTEEDRWENGGGISPFTLAVIISALIEGAAFLEEPACTFARELADDWNASLEQWTFRSGGAVAEKLGISGHYVRLASSAASEDEQIGIDFLQLVRYGLRSADDARVKETIAAVDALLKTDTASGPVWHRYTADAYGERDDGSPCDGSGRGRGWPLLVGERGHYALAAGEDPLPYLQAMIKMSGKGGLLPEQVWDADPIPERGLYPGKPSGSAMPLVWAHAEFIKLAISRARGKLVDRPPRVSQRYHGTVPRPRWVGWSFRLQRPTVPRGLPMRILVTAPAVVRWGKNGWQDIKETATEDSGLSVHWAQLPVEGLTAGDTVNFSFRWQSTGEWEGRDFEVAVASA